MRRSFAASQLTALLFLVAVSAAGFACSQPAQGQTAPSASAPASPAQPGSPVFSPAHRTIGDAVRGFFGIVPKPTEQPIPFPHKAHVAKGLKCTEYCHESVTQGPVAGLPSVRTCMICHAVIAKTRPLIQQVADYQKRGVDIPWQRVYGYTHEAHVRFNHAPHIRANVDCATCHGEVAQQTTAERVKDLNMGFCIDCHKAKNAPNDCLTCHY